MKTECKQKMLVQEVVRKFLDYVKEEEERIDRINRIILDINSDIAFNEKRIVDSGGRSLLNFRLEKNPAGVSSTYHGKVSFPELNDAQAYIKAFRPRNLGSEKYLLITEACMYDKLIRGELNNGLTSNPFLLKNYGVITKNPLPEAYKNYNPNSLVGGSPWDIVNEPIVGMRSVSQLTGLIPKFLNGDTTPFSATFNDFRTILLRETGKDISDIIMLELYTQIIWTLTYFYRHGIIHGDLHSGNMFIVANVEGYTFLLEDIDGEVIVITPKFYPKFFDYDRGFWSPERKDLIKEKGECGFSKKQISDRHWRIQNSPTNSHKFQDGYDLARLFATAYPSKRGKLFRGLYATIFKHYKEETSIDELVLDLKNYQNPETFYGIEDVYAEFKKRISPAGYPIVVPHSRLKNYTYTSDIRIGTLSSSREALDEFLRKINFTRSPTPSNRVSSRGVKCQSFERKLREGAKEAINPRTGRKIKLVTSKGKITATAKKVVEDCGIQLEPPSPRPRGSARVSSRGAKCQSFERKLREGAREAINPRTGRKIKLVTSKGKITATAKKVAEGCGIRL